MSERICFKVEQGRVLVPVGEPCPFGCRYCYTRGGAVGLKRVAIEDILMPLRAFVQGTRCETLQLGYDGDPFAHPERGLTLLRQVAELGKHVNFSTKALLEGYLIIALEELSERMQAAGATLSALVSLSCWQEAERIEPYTPSPEERLRTVANLAHAGIPVFIALRPILPQVPDSDYERIVVEAVRAGCDGFIVGPLYADEKGRFVRFIPSYALASVPNRTGTVVWSAHAPTWTRYEDPARRERLLEMIERLHGRAFLSSAEAVRLAPHLIRHEEGIK